jgi:hypothetical protein
MHPELTLHDGEMCGERKAALNGCPDVEAVAERKHLGPFDMGEAARSL